jgi:hypothetical protein
MALSHSPQIVRDGLVVCLDAANPKSYPGSGTTLFDLKGNNYNGILNNGASYSEINNKAILLDGINDDISISSYKLSISNSLAPYTLSAWIIRTGNTPDGGIITQYSSTTAPGRFGLREISSRLSWFKGGSQLAMSTDIIPVNAWKYVVGVRRADGSVSIYIDGVQVGTGTDTSVFEDATLKIGRFGTLAPFSGRVAQVAIYERALTQEEIKTNFEALRGRFGI